MSAISDEKISGVAPGRNQLPSTPKWAPHRQAVDAVDSSDPTARSEGVDARDFNEVWVDVLVDGVGTFAVATLEVLFWSEAASVTENLDGTYTYHGGWVPSGLSDIAVEAADGGHSSGIIRVAGRPFYLKVKSLGAGAKVHTLVSGVKLRTDL